MVNVPAVNAIIALPFTLTVDAECLGATIRTQFETFDVEVVLPVGQQYQDGRPLIGPPPTPGLREDIDWSQQLSYFSPWGSVVSFSGNQPLTKGDTVDVYHLILRVQAPARATENDAQEIADKLVAEIKPWTHRIADWVELIQATYVTRSAFPGEQSITIGSDLLLWHFDGTKGRTLSRGTLMGPTVMIGRTGMTLDKLQIAVKLVDADRDIPTEYLFLRDARGSLREGSTRRAVLDSATAAEISLAKLIDANTAFAGEPIRKAIRDANRDLGRATRTLRETFSIGLRSDIQEGLVAPRNRAIHAGIEPTLATARLALEIASGLVELATPYAETVHI
jgi:hypothetical protein